MDESWHKLIRTTPSPPAALVPEDFSDVFGGPPKTVLLRKFYGDRTSSSSQSFHGPMPCSQGLSPTSRLSEVFYEDVFIGERNSRDRSGQVSNGLSKSKSKSKSNSSSVLSSDELSPSRPIVGDDVGLSSFGLKLRPINLPCRWNLITADFPSEHQKMQGAPLLPCGRPSAAEDRFTENIHEHSIFKSPRRWLSRRSPFREPFAAEPNSDRDDNTPAEEEEEEVKAASFSSVASGDRDRNMEEKGALAMSDEDDEISSSYVIEITPGIRDGTDKTPRVDEAIAWDKESFSRDNAKNDNKESWSRTGNWKEHILPETKEMQKSSDQAGVLCGKSKSAQMIEFKELDRNMKLWTSGTEKDIRQLLSTLHQIMWLNSGWDAVPLTSLRKSSQVKKAYQKARQCLQPDRLQQSEATSLQKYIAHKALTIIQDSWTKYISEGNSR